MRGVHRSFLAALGALAIGLAIPAVASAQEAEPQPEATPQVTPDQSQRQSPAEARSEMTDVAGGEAVEMEADESSDLVGVARAQGNLSRFLAIVDEAGLTRELSTGGPYTIFAPTDEAFAAMKTAESGSGDELRRLVRTHIAVGDWTSTRLTEASGIKNLLAEDLTLEEKSGTENEATLQVAGANVVKSDIEASNGVIHEIDSVIEVSPAPATEANASSEIDSPDAAEAGAGD